MMISAERLREIERNILEDQLDCMIAELLELCDRISQTKRQLAILDKKEGSKI